MSCPRHESTDVHTSVEPIGVRTESEICQLRPDTQLQTGFKRLCSKFYSYSKAYLSNIPYFIAQFLIDYPPISPITRYFNTLSTQYLTRIGTYSRALYLLIGPYNRY